MEAYLDHASTTPLRPDVLDAMLPYLSARYGNASGPHRLARQARTALDVAREEVAGLLGCDPGEVVFTSGGTESDHLAVTGALAAARDAVDRSGAAEAVAVCSAVEHHAVLRPCVAHGGVVVPVGADGRIDLDALGDALGPSVAVVSVMLANNEIGVVQDLVAVAAVARARAPQAALHTDAVHAVPWLDVARLAAPAALVSISAHKFGGPKGVGALVVRRGARWSPTVLGGEQERGRRPGTENVAGVVGLAAALRATVAERAATVARVGARRDRLAAGLAAVPGLRRTVAPGVERVAGSLHVLVDGVEQEELLVLLDDDGVYASAGSACASGALEPSHVLRAIGLSTAEARTAVRFSLGGTTTDAEVDHALAVVPAAITRLRDGGPAPHRAA